MIITRAPLPAALMALALALPAGGAASPLVDVDRELRVELVNGLPQPLGAAGDVGAFALDVWSRAAREIVVDVEGPAWLRQKLSLPAGERRRFFFYLPRLSGGEWSNGGSVRLSGLPGKDETVRAPVPEFTVWSDKPVIGQLGRIGAPMHAAENWILAGDVLEKMPDHWRGLAGFTALVVEERTLASRPEWLPVVREWVLMGGVLLVSAPYGPLPPRNPAIGLLPLSVPPRGPFVQAGLGLVAYVRPAALADLGDGLFQHPWPADASVRLRASGLPTPRETGALVERERDFVDQVARPPYVGLFVLLATFAVLVGPVAWIFWVHRKARPFVYLGTTIGLAILFGGALMGADLADKGILPLGRATSISLRDEPGGVQVDHHEAVVLAPTGRGTGLRVPLDAALLVHTQGSPGAQELSLEPGAQRVDGAVPVRTGAFVLARRVSRVQGRLVVVEDGEGLLVENQLPHALEELTVWCRGRAFTFGPIARGARARSAAVRPPGAEAVVEKAPEEVGSPELAAAAAALGALRRGDLGTDRYVGVYRGAELREALFPAGMREMGGGKHVVAGIWR